MMTHTPELCARCGAILSDRDFVAEHKDGRKLFFCAQHEREHGEALKAQKWTVTPYEPPTLFGKSGQAECRECKKPAPTRPVKPGATDSKWVTVMVCPRCDTRECNTETGPDEKCRERALDPRQRECANGHGLMGRAS